MGHIKKLLAAGYIEPRYITASQIWTDLCENVHLHYRNIRLDFSQKEWAHFRAAINHLGMAVEHCSEENDYKEGNPNFLIQQIFNHPLKTDSDYYKNRFTLELQKDNTVHLHYRDLRLHFTLPEFEDIAEMFRKASKNLTGGFIFRHSDVTEKSKVTVPIDSIQPYDEGHRPLDIDNEHREGIDYCKRLIGEGKKIRPILVNTSGQRLDGFKRYMAYKELGRTQIECIVDPFGQMGGQHNQSMLADDDVNVCKECGYRVKPINPKNTITEWDCEKCDCFNKTTAPQ